MSQVDYKKILLQLIASLTLCDHMGDVGDDINKTLENIDLQVGEWDDICELGHLLGKMGITTLYETTIDHSDVVEGCRYCEPV